MLLLDLLKGEYSQSQLETFIRENFPNSTDDEVMTVVNSLL